MTQSLIQNNIKELMLYMAHEEKKDVKTFGNIAIAYFDVPTSYLNMIFDYSTTDPSNLKQALAYSQEQRYPFMLIRSEPSNSPVLESIIKQYNYKHVGIATLIEISHESVHFEPIDMASVKVKPVTNQQMLDQFCAIHDEVYALSPGTTQLWLSASNLLSSDFQVKLYLAYVTEDGESKAIGTALLYLPEDKQLLAGHYCWAVKEQYRKRGIMTNMAKNMVLIAKKNGYLASVAQCFDASVRLAEYLGFKQFGKFQLYNNDST